MGRPRRYETPAERQAAYRERKTEAPDTTGAEIVEERAEDLRQLAAHDEQELRDRHGYTGSERRTKAERDTAARRMVERSGVLNTEIELPFDIAAVWTGESADTARYLVGQWGAEAFRASAVHRSALAEEHHRALRAENLRRAERSKQNA